MWYQVSIKYVAPNGDVGRIQKVVETRSAEEAKKVALSLPNIKELKLPTVTSVSLFEEQARLPI